MNIFRINTNCEVCNSPILKTIVLIVLSAVSSFAQHKVTLSCTASTSVVSGYNVYRSANSGATYTKINTALVPTCSYVDLVVTGGTKYVYAMTAVDASGNESVFSNTVAATVPEAPPTGVKVTVTEIMLDNDSKEE